MWGEADMQDNTEGERDRKRERERQVKRSSGNGHLEKYGKTEAEGERKWRENKINYQ